MKRILIVIVLILITVQGYAQCNSFSNKKDVKDAVYDGIVFLDKDSNLEIEFTSSKVEIKSSGATLLSAKYEKIIYSKVTGRGIINVSFNGRIVIYKIACRDGSYVLYIEDNGKVTVLPEKNSPLSKTSPTELAIKTPTNDGTNKAPTNERSSKTYSNVETIKIGTQVWTKENLNTSEFNNGDPIMEARSESEWISAYEEKTPAWCYYENNSNYGKKYGKLYNWYAVNDPRGLAPEGYHIPVYGEWIKLEEFLGSENAKRMKSTESGGGWISKKYCDNSSGFSALPGGGRTSDGEFLGSGFNPSVQFTRFWAGSWELGRELGDWDTVYSIVLENSTRMRFITMEPGCGYSIRCVKNKN